MKLICKRNNLHIKQLDAFCRFFNIFMLEKKIRNLFMIWTVFGPNCLVFICFFNFIINELNQISSLF